MESVCLGDMFATQIQLPVKFTAANLRLKSTGRAHLWAKVSAAHRCAKASGYCMRLGIANRRLAPY
jgi:hypothetical protein